MELRDLEYFKMVVEQGSILKASTKLNISQPPLSRMMKQLEEELHTTLFLRGKSITLTEAGKFLYEKACLMLSLRDDTLKELAILAKQNTITLNLGIVSSSTNFLYHDTIEYFHSSNPNIHFNITEANTYQLVELLNQKIIDLAIVRTPFDYKSFNTILFDEEPMVALSKASMPANISIKELTKKPLIVYRRFKNILTELFQKTDTEFNIIALVDDAKTAILLASTSLGIALVPKSAAKTFEHLALNESIINEKSLVTSLALIYRQNEQLKPAYQAFINYLKENKKSNI